METKGIDLTKLNEAVEKFGSLQKVNTKLKKDKVELEKKNTSLKLENKNLEAIRDGLISQIEDMNTKKENYQNQLQYLSRQIQIHCYQYELFCSFMAMVLGSPSVSRSLNYLVTVFQNLIDNSWYGSKSADEMRSLFVRTVMGDYLKCYYCNNCMAKFFVNKAPYYKILGNHYYCPSCYSSSVEADDSFLQAMVSEQQLENTIRLDKILKEYEMLSPFKAFLDQPCEICHEPVNEWDEYNIKLAIQGIGCGHTLCWRSNLGRMKELAKALSKYNK